VRSASTSLLSVDQREKSVASRPVRGAKVAASVVPVRSP